MVSLLFINNSPAAMVIHTSGGTPPFNAGAKAAAQSPKWTFSVVGLNTTLPLYLPMDLTS